MDNKIEKEIKNRIDEIPGDDGWWKESNRDTFYSAARKLVNNGFSINSAIDLLSELFLAVRSEFGD